jgi:hypothetical protein
MPRCCMYSRCDIERAVKVTKVAYQWRDAGLPYSGNTKPHLAEVGNNPAAEQAGRITPISAHVLNDGRFCLCSETDAEGRRCLSSLVGSSSSGSQVQLNSRRAQPWKPKAIDAILPR